MMLSEFLNEFQLEAGEKLDLIASQLLRLERDATNPQPVREMFLAAHTIKGGAAMLRLTDVEALAHAVEDLLSSFRDQQRTLDAPTADLLFQSIDHLRALIATASSDAVAAEPDARVVSFAGQLRANASGQVGAHSETSIVPRPRLRRALLVDDSPTVRGLHGMLLEDAGFEVEACEDGQVALSRALSLPFDLVVAGLQNKGLSGFELTSALRLNPAYRDVPIILMSSDADPDLPRRAAQCGARALVRKGSAQDERLSEVLRELSTPSASL
jgi:CheY-like chemotaxis protein/HPt (histidine-containing phosphotransfer) domain-containing protein